eukprot:4244148-Alexandrium_andersonii.AAC.1
MQPADATRLPPNAANKRSQAAPKLSQQPQPGRPQTQAANSAKPSPNSASELSQQTQPGGQETQPATQPGR